MVKIWKEVILVYLKVLSLHLSRQVTSILAGIQIEYKSSMLMLSHAWSCLMAVQRFKLIHSGGWKQKEWDQSSIQKLTSDPCSCVQCHLMATTETLWASLMEILTADFAGRRLKLCTRLFVAARRWLISTISSLGTCLLNQKI
jgi:hypothetical protein